MKRILILIDWYYPAYKAGGPIQSCINFVTEMQEKYHIDIFTSNQDFGENENLDVTTDTWVKGLLNENVFYCTKSYYSKNVIKQIIAERNPDFVYYNSMFSYRYTILPLLTLKKWSSTKAAILAPRGMLQDGAMQFKNKKKKLFLQLLRLLRIPQHITFQATDEQEAVDIKKYFSKYKGIEIVSNFSKPVPEDTKSITKEKESLKMVFISRIVEKKNLLFIIQLLDNIKGNLHIEFTICGDIGDNDYWELCKTEIQKNTHKNITIVYKGAIKNELVLDTLYAHHVFILTSYGENFGHAIYEAFSAGRPVILSDQTPWNNLQIKKVGWDLPLNDAEAYVKAINTLANMNQEEYDRYSKSALQYAHDYYKSSSVKEKYFNLFN